LPIHQHGGVYNFGHSLSDGVHIRNFPFFVDTLIHRSLS